MDDRLKIIPAMLSLDYKFDENGVCFDIVSTKDESILKFIRVLFIELHKVY